ncbi:Plug domain-containing protein [Novosphingobium sp.]|uniref:Plug domain-containing protein n=1 Tax=Novosphingobium sp. TaxID=1874826 RepID=UPI003340EE3E
MPALAQTAAPAPAADAPKPAEEIVITGALNALPVRGVGSVFGFDKTLVETPRSASTISKEQMDRFGITQIYDLVSQVPGTFTSSFFRHRRRARHSWRTQRRLLSWHAAAGQPRQLCDPDRRG